jgi:predicted CXXCH cytochrome family protein
MALHAIQKSHTVVLVLLAALGFAHGCGGSGGDNSATTAPAMQHASFVGRAACKTCHEREYKAWKGSDHDRAMEAATEETVLGDFSGVRFTAFGVTSRFFRRDGGFFVSTEGPDGSMGEFKVSYTFGVFPLQQYLVAFPGGRYQVLPLCWDTRPHEQGGQRWFQIYPEQRIRHDDELFWTGRNQNWNYMCAECHSTHLQKNFNDTTRTYSTTWSEIDVSCEACHGPGSAHVAWADARQKGLATDDLPAMGLTVRLKDPDRGTWVFDQEVPTARRSVPLRSTVQIEACARCHARRVQFSPDYVYGEPLLQTHYPEMLEERLYFPDGQIREEVYVYGSFRQSKMYHNGVVCSDCHDPHTAKVYVAGNALCYRCHSAESYGVRAHHFHNPDSTGASCVECHAPERTYMVIDPRRDHSFRIPRPDLSLRLNIPNACTGCHRTRTNQWAADSVARWYGPDRVKGMHYGEVLHAAREDLPGAGLLLVNLASGRDQAAIVRATAAALLSQFPGDPATAVLQAAVYDPDPIVRIGAVRGMEYLDADRRFALAKHLLQDKIRIVRTEAARLLASVSPLSISSGDRAALEAAVQEYIAVQLFNADRPESFANLGNLYRDRGMAARAESAYVKAIALGPDLVPSYVNLADLYRSLNRDDEGERVLRKALAVAPGFPAAHHALGLLLVREGRREEALPHLERAHRLAPEDITFGYVYGIALHSLGRSDEAVSVLESTLESHPYDQRLLLALVTVNRERGSVDMARRYASRLVESYPENREYRQLLNQMGALP